MTHLLLAAGRGCNGRAFEQSQERICCSHWSFCCERTPSNSNTFMMISGTSKVLSKSGPVDLLKITKMLHKTQENYGTILGKYCFCRYGTHKISNKIEICMSYVPVLFVVSPLFRFSCVFLIYILKILLRRWGLKIMNFISLKKTWTRNDPTLFYFQER